MKKSLAITIFCLLGAVILGLGAYAWRLDSGLERSGRAVSAYGSAAMGEFAGALSRLDGNLRAAGYAADGALRSTLSAGAAAEAASAVTALSSSGGRGPNLNAPALSSPPALIFRWFPYFINPASAIQTELDRHFFVPLWQVALVCGVVAAVSTALIVLVGSRREV